MNLVKAEKVLTRVYSKHKFLKSFPFADFEISAEEFRTPIMEIEELVEGIERPYVVNFTYARGKQKTSISVFDKELEWLGERAEYINELDSVVELVNDGLATNEITTKRDVVQITEKWLKSISDSRSALNYSTFNDILMRLIGASQLKETVELINNLNKLSAGAKVIRLEGKQYDIIMTYYDFQMIYCKLILGIIIAAKISL